VILLTTNPETIPRTIQVDSDKIASNA
jgi:hypothetical protein